MNVTFADVKVNISILSMMVFGPSVRNAWFSNSKPSPRRTPRRKSPQWFFHQIVTIFMGRKKNESSPELSSYQEILFSEISVPEVWSKTTLCIFDRNLREVFP